MFLGTNFYILDTMDPKSKKYEIIEFLGEGQVMCIELYFIELYELSCTDNIILVKKMSAQYLISLFNPCITYQIFVISFNINLICLILSIIIYY